MHFVWHLSVTDLVQSVRFSIVDAVIYLCWAVADYVLIGHVSARYGETGQVTLAVGISLIEFGVIFDVTDPELKIDGLSSFVINGLLTAQKEKVYLTTTGYNRNMIRFSKT